MRAGHFPAVSSRVEKWIRLAFSCLMGFLLLEYLWRIMVFDNRFQNTPGWILNLRMITALLGIFLVKARRYRVFRLMFLYLLLILLRILLRVRLTFQYSMLKTFTDLLWVFGGCYSLGFILTGPRLKQFFFSVGLVWTTVMTGISLLGIHAAWMRVVIPNFTGTSFVRLWGEAGSARLKLFYLSSISGSLMSMSVLFAVLCLLCVRRTWVKVLLAFSVIPMLLALCLTDSRTSQISLSVGVAMLAVLRLLACRQNRTAVRKSSPPAVQMLQTAVVFILSFALVLLALQQVNPLFDSLKQASQSWPFLRSAAFAGEDPVLMASRDLWGEGVLTGRDEIWRGTIEYLKLNPRSLLIGESILKPLEKLNEACLVSFELKHTHNMLLQILLESGIPGLVLVFLILLPVGRDAVQLFRDKEKPVWLRAFPALLLMVCVESMTDCIAWSGFPYLPELAFFFMVAGCCSSCYSTESAAFIPSFLKRCFGKPASGRKT